MRAAKGDGSVFKTETGYRGYVTVNGRRKYFSAKTKAEAGQKRRELLQRREQGVLVTGRSPSIEAWLTHWIDSIASLRPTTEQTHRFVIEKKIIPALGSKTLDTLTAEDVEHWLNTMNVTQSTKQRYLAPLKAALKVAVKRGKVGFSVIDRLENKPKQGQSKAVALSREDRQMILTTASGRNRARWHLALKLGLRPGEALGLTWPDFDENAGTLTIRNQLLRAKGVGLYLQAETKTQAGERPIKLPKSLVRMLVDHRREQLHERAEMGDEWVGWEYHGQPVPLMFTQRNGRPIDARMDTSDWKLLLSASGLPKTKRYTMRHTAASHLVVDSGGDIAVTAHVLGHADPAFTYRTYVHPLAEREADLMGKLDELDAPYVAPYGADEGRRQPTGEGPRGRETSGEPDDSGPPPDRRKLTRNE